MNPQQLSPAQLTPLLILGALLLGFGWIVWARALHKMRTVGGAVDASRFALPELLVATVLAISFSAMVVRSAMAAHSDGGDMTGGQVLPSAVMFLAIVVGLSSFLSFRRLDLREIFGLARFPLPAVLGWAALLLIAAFPFVALANAISVSLLGSEATEQALVRLFRAAAERGDYSIVGKVIFAGVFVAPLCEEFLFRGFFYGVGKRFAGAWISGFVTALLFAAFHASLTSLPGLFVLAVAFTLAYERTGSLFVPITMHAIFNATSLAILYAQSLARPLPA